MGMDVLTGGVDVSASLAQGAIVRHRGILDVPDQMLIVTMAERMSKRMAGILADCLDRYQGNRLIVLDEHIDEEPAPPLSLTDRLAFHVTLDGISTHDIEAVGDANAIDIRDVHVPEKVIEDIVGLAVSLGITSLRAPTFAFNAAKAHAALNQRTRIAEEDIIVAAELVLAPRATQLPQPEEEKTREEPPSEPESMLQQEQQDAHLPEDILLAAIQTALPHDLLSKTGANKAKNPSGSGAGQKRVGNRRGRPLPARDTGAPKGQARVDLMATLRAAVPWQKLRKQGYGHRVGPVILPTDLRYRRYEDLCDRLLIFAVDASGSAAIARLAEAKGAVELLLAEAYARRDHVALVSFRGDTAETLLPPTRSLVQTKRRLAELPGGGGTPLAAGLRQALEIALQANRKGLAPVIIVLTDGRSNVALDGSANRAQAAEDSSQVARQIAHAGIDTILIDTGKRPERALQSLSGSLRGHYVSLPRADAKALSDTVTVALGS
jgi:magnesium chelatase subunit D